jgi:hypothetical protein
MLRKEFERSARFDAVLDRAMQEDRELLRLLSEGPRLPDFVGTGSEKVP